MKKIIICGAILLASAITALSFNKKDDTATQEQRISIEKTKLTKKSFNTPVSDISTAD